MAIAAWRLPDYALNYRFNPTVNSSSSSFMTETNICNSSSKRRNIIVNTETSNSINANNTVSQSMFMLDSFTWLEIILAVIIGLASSSRKKQTKT